ncbi:MAG: MotA/TolQ/ExbB proton channel family protein [Desulfobacterales bacterium]|nr:MotA/TolQ/ExbB proton channel family protein [Desulfobacterales bacterium]
MEFIQWFLGNFGIFFGSLFLIYLYLMIRRIILLVDVLRHVPRQVENCSPGGLPDFLQPLLEHLRTVSTLNPERTSLAADAVWAELDCRVSVHFQAVSGYVSTIVLVGFAGTIFGSIGAFNEMFQGLSQGEPGAQVFAAAWNKGLSTALYTSLGAAAMGSGILTLLGSRFLLTRAKRLEAIVSLEICRVLEEG